MNIAATLPFMFHQTDTRATLRAMERTVSWSYPIISDGAFPSREREARLFILNRARVGRVWREEIKYHRSVGTKFQSGDGGDDVDAIAIANVTRRAFIHSDALRRRGYVYCFKRHASRRAFIRHALARARRDGRLIARGCRSMENARNTDTAVPGGRSDTLAGDRTGE